MKNNKEKYNNFIAIINECAQIKTDSTKYKEKIKDMDIEITKI
jgi:hypothetical protein